ncbi:hypothetical protein [Actinoplanes sp. NPDC049599]|uniref:hypothetical protein n=1 Tax=Actinoplanes sp. NPDC049599 TaxID=3363903 RepID=UPI003792FFB8
MTTTTPGWMRRRSGPQWAHASGILNTARTVTPEVVWACGPYLAQHAYTIAAIWTGEHPLNDGRSGSLDRGQYHVRRSRIIVIDYTDTGGRHERLVIPTRAVERLVADRAAFPAGLIAAADEVLAERLQVTTAQMAHNQRYLLGQDPPSRDERDAQFRWHADVERRCQDVAADLWQHVCPPPPKPVQLGLFDLAGAR